MRWYCSKCGHRADFKDQFDEFLCIDGPEHEIHRGNPKKRNKHDAFQELLDERIQEEENELIDEYGEDIDSDAAAFNAGWNWVPPEEDEFEEEEEEGDDEENC